jgi:hypothetical protein
LKVDKVILTNLGVLRSKYGPSGVRAIRAGISRLIAADRARRLTTKLISIDDARTMRNFSGREVTKVADPQQNKKAVDAVYRALAPDYILLLGSIDVIPHQDLRNPLYTTARGDDTDRNASGDLPYACEAAYSHDVAGFIGQTRVVGRLPDIAGATEPSYLLRLLKIAAAAKPKRREDYSSYLALTAQIWERSTRQSAREVFGDSKSVQTVPPHSSTWSTTLLQRRVHFINCHGASHASEFFGQPASGRHKYPIALKSSYIAGKIAAGTVVAAECCYGGQLNRISPSRPRLGICEVYLGSGGWGFVGSTTIAYGDFERNGMADLICQFFLEEVRNGASLGRAFLEARHKFVHKASPLNPSELKTLAQFNLYGDPSLVLVGREALPSSTKVPISAMAGAEQSERHDRRRALFKQGVELSQSEPVPKRTSKRAAPAIQRALNARARELKLQPTTMLSFAIRHRGTGASGARGLQALPQALAEKTTLPVAYHVLFCKTRVRPAGADVRRLGIPDVTALIGKEVNGVLASYIRIHSC